MVWIKRSSHPNFGVPMPAPLGGTLREQEREEKTTLAADHHDDAVLTPRGI